MATWDDAVEHQDSKKVLLAEINAGQRLSTWQADGTYTATWTTTTGYRISDVTDDGVSLSAAATITACNSTADSYFWDSDAGTLNVNLDGDDPHDSVMVAEVRLNYSTHPKLFSSIPYFARLMRAPSVSLRVSETFDGVGQIGGGSMLFANGDALFDGMSGLDFDYATVTLKLGLDVMR